MKQNHRLFDFGIVFLLLASCADSLAQSAPSADGAITGVVDFDDTLRDWDGFGVNYVEMAQSTDPLGHPQDYGGLSLLSEEQRRYVLRLIFGANGLQPGIIKMFLDPFHQREPGGPFDHASTTAWMRYFARNGVEMTRDRGGAEIAIITTLYGPPAWATKQRFLRGRDLDPGRFPDLASYMIDWVRYLSVDESLPVRYLSLHNEGDSPHRWPIDGNGSYFEHGHDYNAFWRPNDVALFLEFMPALVEAAGLDVGITPGETTYWRNLHANFYTWAIHDSQAAINNMGLVTSHGFGDGGAIQSYAVDFFRHFRPGIHAWTTSASWGIDGESRSIDFVNTIRRNVYDAKVNALIPWAILKTSDWKGGDPNSSSAIVIDDDGGIDIRPQYYFYKQLSVAGQPGTRVARVEIEPRSSVELMAFAAGESGGQDAFLVINLDDRDRSVSLAVAGQSTTYSAYRTSDSDQYDALGRFELINGNIDYRAPARSVTTFFGH